MEDRLKFYIINLMRNFSLVYFVLQRYTNGVMLLAPYLLGCFTCFAQSENTLS